MSHFKRSRFRVQKQRLLQRPTLTKEQDGVWRMIEKSGSPQAAAQDLVSRLVALEEAVAALEQAQGEQEAEAAEAEAADPPSA